MTLIEIKDIEDYQVINFEHIKKIYKQDFGPDANERSKYYISRNDENLTASELKFTVKIMESFTKKLKEAIHVRNFDDPAEDSDEDSLYGEEYDDDHEFGKKQPEPCAICTNNIESESSEESSSEESEESEIEEIEEIEESEDDINYIPRLPPVKKVETRGRPKKFHNEEDRLQSLRDARLSWYYRNRKTVLDRYRENNPFVSKGELIQTIETLQLANA